MEEERARRQEAARSQAQDKIALHRKAKGTPSVGRKRARVTVVTDDEEEDVGDERGRLKKKKKGE